MGVSLLPWAFLLMAAALTSEATEEPPVKQVSCCFSFLSRKIIPLSRVESYTLTSSQCLIPGIIFQTKRGIKICADPKQNWVKRIVQVLDQKEQTAKPDVVLQSRDG